MKVEPLRSVRSVCGSHRSRNLTILGVASIPTLNRIVDRSGMWSPLRRKDCSCQRLLPKSCRFLPASACGLRSWKAHARYGKSRWRGLVDEFLGLSVYMDGDALHRLMREGDTLSGAYLQVVPQRSHGFTGGSNRRPPWQEWD